MAIFVTCSREQYMHMRDDRLFVDQLSEGQNYSALVLLDHKDIEAARTQARIEKIEKCAGSLGSASVILSILDEDLRPVRKLMEIEGETSPCGLWIPRNMELTVTSPSGVIVGRTNVEEGYLLQYDDGMNGRLHLKESVPDTVLASV